MARNVSKEERESISRLHGIPASAPPPKRTLIPIPRNGAVPTNSSSPKHGQFGRHKSSYPNPQPPFRDNLHDDVDRQSARRTGYRSASQSTPSPNSQARLPPTTSKAALIDISASSKPDKGKGKAQDVSPRTTRSKSLRKASAQSETINLASDDDGDDDVLHIVPQPSSSSRASKRPSELADKSAALQAKDKRRRNEAASSSKSMQLSATPLKSFYASPETSRARPANRPNLNFIHRRPDGPIQLEEPNPRRPSGSTSVVHVRESPDSEPDIEVISPHRLNRGSSSQPRPKIVDRMKPKASSSVLLDLVAPRSSSAAADKVSSSRSPTRSPQSTSNLEPSPSPQDHDINDSSRGLKHSRADTATSPSQEKPAHDEPLTMPFEVHLRAVVVSDAWRSRAHDQPRLVVNLHALFFGVDVEQMIKIRYSDIRQVMASKLDVKHCGTFCFTLTPNSESAANVQHIFSDYDPRASGDAAQIQLIARDLSQVDLLNHNRAIVWITQRLRESSTDSVKLLWLDRFSAKSKISSVDTVKQASWPDPSTTPAQPRPKRTIIRPGDSRPPDVPETTRTITTYTPSVPRKKTFNIQPDSPKFPADVNVDVDMPDAFSKSKSPTTPSLSIPKAKPALNPAPKVEVRRPRVSSDGTILVYPYEGIGAMSLRDSDFDKLLEGGLLNDVVIEFGMKFILEEIRAKDPQLADSIHVFNTFFIPILMSDSVENSYAKLRRWTAKEDLFSKKYIVIPVNENYHWYLALIVNPAYILTEHSKDNSSEQDKEEVAQALTPPLEDATRQPSSLNGATPAESKEAAPEPRKEATMFGSEEPETPPLPPLHLPLQSFGNSSASLPSPMDVDRGSRGGTPTRTTANATDPDQLIIITLDSLGQRHVKLSNKLFEYLWREAWDKKKSTILKPPKETIDDKDSQTKPHDKINQDASLPERSDEMTHAQAAASDKEGPRDQAKETPKDATNNSTEEAAVHVDGVRSVKVQDKRRSVAYAATKPAEAEAWAKTLSKAVYINAQVPEQPNFCDCGIYLLHYIDRFFREPDKLLKLMVNAKDRLGSANKAGSAMRQQVKKDIERSVEAEWQAGEVNSKRAYWRSKLVELSEGWEEYKKMKKRKEESGAKSEQEETKPGKDQKEQEQAPSPPKDGDIPMPDADPERGGNNEDLPSMEQSQKASEEDTADSLGVTGVSLDEIERSVNDCVHGTDPVASLVVDNILAQAMAAQNGPLSQEQLEQLQMEDRQEADHRKPASEGRFNSSDIPRSAVPKGGNPASNEAPSEPRVLGQL